MREIKEIISDQKNYFNLVKELVRADFKLRYQGSFLGVLWSLLEPMLLFGVLLFIFSVFARFQIENYAFHLLIGVILWNFFQEATTSSMYSLMLKARLIKKIYFPRSAIVISSTINSLINTVFGLFVLIIFMMFSNFTFGFFSLTFLIFLIELYVVTLGIGLAISSISTIYKDLTHIWPILLRVGFWLSPIVYSIEMVPEKYRFIMLLNPITSVIHYSRDILFYNNITNPGGVFILTFTASLIFIAGLEIFSRMAPQFPENL